MFSFFRKKPKQTISPTVPAPAPLPPSTPKNVYKQEYLTNINKYEKEAAQVRELFPSNYPKSKPQMIDFLVQLRLLAHETKIMEEKFQQEKQRKAKERDNLHQLLLQERAIEEERLRKQQQARNRRLSNLTRKHGYKSQKNLLNNAARQRGTWRSKNPSAKYYSLENFVESEFFKPHLNYTGTTLDNENNNETISLNSPRSIRSNSGNSANSFFGGKRRKTLRRIKKG
jgi:hypothetical protein